MSITSKGIRFIVVASLVMWLSTGTASVLAWTQWLTPNGGTMCGTLAYPNDVCLKYPPNGTFPYYFRTLFRSDFKTTFRNAVNHWNARPYRNPLVTEGSTGMGISATAVDAGICGIANVVRDPYHTIAGSTNPNKNSNYVDWGHTTVVYNNNVNYGNPASGCQLENMFVQETGHAMEALSHSRDSSAVMYPFSNGVTIPNADDEAGLRALYGSCGC